MLGATTIAMTRAFRAHMEVEQKNLLHPDVLTDSIIQLVPTITSRTVRPHPQRMRVMRV